MQFLFEFLLVVTAIFLIVLVLIQRGKGGGLAGAFGGMGGQSAFGTKAGDLFTRITIGVAAFWIILCIVTVKLLEGRPARDRWTRARAAVPSKGRGQRRPPRPRSPQPAARRRRRGRQNDLPSIHPGRKSPARCLGWDCPTGEEVTFYSRSILAVLLSMTGFGEMHCQRDGVAVAIEVRAINNRYFKLAVRSTEGTVRSSRRSSPWCAEHPPRHDPDQPSR